MIIDWKKQCEKIARTNELDRQDPSDNKIYFKQEVAYIRFLINSGLSYDECQAKWLALKNGVAAQFKDDKEQLVAQFRRSYNKAKTKAYLFVDNNEGLEPAVLYATEVAKINALKCDKWIKEYILILLVYYKFAHQINDGVEYSTTLVNWALRQIDTNDHKFRSYRDARSSIAKVLRETKTRVLRFSPIKKRERYTTYSIPFACNDGEELIRLESLHDISRAFCLLRNDFAFCSECGTRFAINAKTKRCLCESCYTIYRRKYKTAKDKEYYYRDKNIASGQ